MSYALDALAARLRGTEPQPADDGPHDGPRAAVAAILKRNAAGEAELFFIQRAEHPNDPWSGHIAFPGGRRDPGDPSLLATAVRETREEVGLDLEREAELVTRLPDVPAYARSKRTNLVVTPFVFALAHDAPRVTANVEVAHTLWVPFQKLALGEGKGTMQYDFNGTPIELPCIRLEDRVLWGLTYRMLELMLERLG